MRRGLTLIELLIVIALIAVISGLIYTALIEARKRAYLAVCISNLRQLIQAAHMYEQDWGTVPVENIRRTDEGEFGWAQQLLFPYVNDIKVFICPMETGEFRANPIWKGKRWPTSYLYHVTIWGVEEYKSTKLKPRSPLISCLNHISQQKIVLIGRYDGTVEIAPFGRYESIGPEFETSLSKEIE